MDKRPLIGLAGVLLATMAGDINDQATSISLVDMRAGLGISYDAGTWIESLYLSAQPIGMLVSAWFMITFSLKRWALVVIGVVGLASLALPFSPNVQAFYALRALQGLAGGLITPLLMDTALFVLPPSIRLYGLAAYALTATFIPSITTTITALWVDVVHVDFVFYQALPMCTLGAVLVWYGLPDEEAHLERLRIFDWRGLLLGATSMVALTTMLYHGDRLDWFNSKFVCVLGLVTVVTLPLFLVNEWFHPLPFLKLQLLARRNFTYGICTLFMLILILTSSGTVPLEFLIEVNGYRPLQANLVTLEVALLQLLLLPLVAKLLDFPSVDARIVGMIGFALIAVACLGCSSINIYWNRNQFYGWQAVQALGQAMVVVPLLMLATNEVLAKSEAPWASAMVNFPRSVAEVVGVWMIGLIALWRGRLHSDRLTYDVGMRRWPLVEGNGVIPHFPPPLLPDGRSRFDHSLEHFHETVRQQVTVMTTADTYLIVAGLALVMVFVTAVLTVPSLPPRLKFPNGLPN